MLPLVDWNVFESLPGAVQTNFELLCRMLMRLHYDQYGDFVALANQPGVEFHLKLHTSCALGSVGSWFGWQCRWYDRLPSGRSIGSARKRKIVEAISKTEKELPSLTDWVLWTRYPLTEGDQAWLRGLRTHMRLHLWTTIEVEQYLCGEGELLRGTYFGELVLTPEVLMGLHRIAVAPIRRRWRPELHQTIDAEREIKRALGDFQAWEDLSRLSGCLRRGTQIFASITDLAAPCEEISENLSQMSERLATALDNISAGLQRGDLDLLKQVLADCLGVSIPGSQFHCLLCHLQAKRHASALYIQGPFADMQAAVARLQDLNAYLSKHVIIILAEAGCGKTHLAAQISTNQGQRPAGILMHGRDLQGGCSLDDLAHRVVIRGSPIPSMEALVAALDAAGRRAQRRLPLVIDALNESEDPRDWKRLLGPLHEILRHYPYVLVVGTLRTGFSSEALPSGLSRIEMEGFEDDGLEAIRRYFMHYRIDPADAEVPIGLLSHPLTLGMFCEVTNPTRERVVGIESAPQSLTGLFDLYLTQASDRVAELSSRDCRYYAQDVRTALDQIGMALLEERTSTSDLTETRRNLGDDRRQWGQSIIFALEQEGILLRVPGPTAASGRVQVAFDALAGHLVADAIIANRGSHGLCEWLEDPETVNLFTGDPPDRHPLAEDMFQALIGLVPRRLRRIQLWAMVKEPMKTAALRGTANLEGAYLDAQTVETLASLVLKQPAGHQDLLLRLWHIRGLPVHPLNAEFLDSVLRPLSVTDRDLRWTEWIRRNSDGVLKDLRHMEERWRTRRERTPGDRLRGRWAMWTLCSTVRRLRDQATRTLYWFGRWDPASLFDLTMDSLSINDPYVGERMLAAGYGVAMAHQLHNPDFGALLGSYLARLDGELFGPNAKHPTYHWLARLYAVGTVEFGQTFYPDAVPDNLRGAKRVCLAPGPVIEPIASSDPRADEVGETLHMDFSNYTLGRLFDDRGNYDSEHAGYVAAVDYVRGAVWALGWRRSAFGSLDREIATRRYSDDRPHTERYGKKYSWIAFYVYAGILEAEGLLVDDEGRMSEVDIDPSFPDAPPEAPVTLPLWARRTPVDDPRWVRTGRIIVPDGLLHCDSLGPYHGPWVAVRGHLRADTQTPGRRVFGILTGVLVRTADAARLMNAMQQQDLGRWWLPEPPADYYTYAGEIPWHSEFGRRYQGRYPSEPYRGALEIGDGGAPVRVEILAHDYAWESYHSEMNQSGHALIPSRAFSAQFGLRGVAQNFHQVLKDRSVGAVSFGGPPEFGGHLLYLREDLVKRYARGRDLVWLVWGERQLYPFRSRNPRWLEKVRLARQDVWRHVSSLSWTDKGDATEGKHGADGTQEFN